jgi:hypothetical protein
MMGGMASPFETPKKADMIDQQPFYAVKPTMMAA